MEILDSDVNKFDKEEVEAIFELADSNGDGVIGMASVSENCLIN